MGCNATGGRANRRWNDRARGQTGGDGHRGDGLLARSNVGGQRSQGRVPATATAIGAIVVVVIIVVIVRHDKRSE